MSLNLSDFSYRMTNELDQAISKKPVTSFLIDNSLREKFVGTKTVMIPNVSLSGLGNYNRDSGFSNGALDITAQPYVLRMDRGRSFQIDREDYDESGIADLAGQVMGEFVRTKVAPEMDAYVLSRLASYAYSAGNTVSGSPETDVFSLLSLAIQHVQEGIGYDEELVAFVDSTVWTAMQNSQELTRVLVASDFVRGDVHTEVFSYNGVTILPVQNSRMKTAFNFYDGVTDGQTSGGFEMTSDAMNVGILIVPRRAASIIKKTEQVRCFDPTHNLTADAWKMDYRLYYDVVFRNNLADYMYGYFY